MRKSIRIDFSKVHRIHTRSQIGEFEEYLTTLENLLKQHQTSFKQRVTSEAKRLTRPEDQIRLYDWHADEYWRYEEYFPKLMRNSFLVTVFSFLEYKLGEICSQMHSKKGVPFDWRELKGDVLDRANLYIERLTGEGPKSTRTWIDIKQFQQLRNCIVHNNGQPNTTEACEYATRKGLLPDRDDTLLLTYSFCQEVITKLQGFFDELYDSLQDL